MVGAARAANGRSLQGQRLRQRDRRPRRPLDHPRQSPARRNQQEGQPEAGDSASSQAGGRPVRVGSHRERPALRLPVLIIRGRIAHEAGAIGHVAMIWLEQAAHQQLVQAGIRDAPSTRVPPQAAAHSMNGWPGWILWKGNSAADGLFRTTGVSQRGMRSVRNESRGFPVAHYPLRAPGGFSP